MNPNVKGIIISESSTITNSPEIVSYDKERDTVKFRANLQDGDKPNRNKRIYSTEVLKEAIQMPYIQERLRTNSFYGEAGK